MKSCVVIVVNLLFSSFCFAQQLTIEETVAYINANLEDEFELNILEGSNFKIFQDKSSDQYWKDYNNVMNQHFPNHSAYSTSYAKEWSYNGNLKKVQLKKSISYSNDFLLEFNCINNSPCFYISGFDYKVTFENNRLISKNKYLIPQYNKNTYKFELSFKNEHKRDKLYNAFRYLIELIKIDPKYNSIDEDPFSDENFHSLYTYISGKKTRDEIQLKSDAGTYYVLVDIEGISNEFVLDSGASEISISLNLERELISKGLLTKQDYLQPALYRIADGSITWKKRVNLKRVKVGDFIVNNVAASIGGERVPLLLGKSFLDNFNKWSIDNSTEKLILEK